MRRSKQLGKKERRRADNSVYKIERAARDRADDQARRVPWQLLLETRNQYVEMQEFCFWARSVIEIEDGIPGWLAKMLDRRCPGFIEDQQRCESDRSRTYPPLSVRLLFWSQEHMFGRARNEGWFDAVQFYAIRDSRSTRAEVYWSECVKKWRKAKPQKYPSLKQWLSDAAGCDPFTHLTPGARKARASYRLVEPKRLTEAVARYIDWEALAYWARPALEAGPPLVHKRCPRTRSSMSWVLGVQRESAEGRSRRFSARLASIDALDNGPLLSGRQNGRLDGCDLVVCQESSRCDTHDGVLGAV